MDLYGYMAIGLHVIRVFDINCLLVQRSQFICNIQYFDQYQEFLNYF